VIGKCAEATETPKYNPLEKLPILLFPDGRAPVYVYLGVFVKGKGKGREMVDD
jgi:hypothetical protein